MLVYEFLLWISAFLGISLDWSLVVFLLLCVWVLFVFLCCIDLFSDGL